MHHPIVTYIFLHSNQESNTVKPYRFVKYIRSKMYKHILVIKSSEKKKTLRIREIYSEGPPVRHTIRSDGALNEKYSYITHLALGVRLYRAQPPISVATAAAAALALFSRAPTIFPSTPLLAHFVNPLLSLSLS